MKYRLLMSMAVDAQSDAEVVEYARKLSTLLKSPLVRMAVEGEGIRLSGDGQPIVYAPQREAP